MCHIPLTPRDKTVLTNYKWLQNSQKDSRKMCTNPYLFTDKNTNEQQSMQGNIQLYSQMFM